MQPYKRLIYYENNHVAKTCQTRSYTCEVYISPRDILLRCLPNVLEDVKGTFNWRA